MAITPADVKARFPVLDAVEEAQLQLLIDDTRPFFNIDRWGAFYPRGACLLVAHFWSMQQKVDKGETAPVYAVTARKAGEVQLSYASPSPLEMQDAWLAATSYGQQYLSLRKQVGFGALVV
ncbi:Uncharacterized protein MCB1EB_1556 [Mycoavidus cysteinexigens]|uniref:Uncharacterized protein n=1 Tax=Mycoavidus cysteinexigens TaxID=1553431 RepID=A0A2Z6EW87_9BURK|nr:DUF4054 domain-containing protein [Mycoavidus cysteinexigens]BBE09717.1 Uncharacterized protein MCB1EB_1556 [Mycoavidus cysteinexigens]GAM53925.1 hypothetical protein EBME_2388 [bacterium endosymbiont of Mortierella elongata FMR23-6]GLR02213.1 hypothetical protein GCM10007934_20280 [Mycoavidus cysteinexigens]